MFENDIAAVDVTEIGESFDQRLEVRSFFLGAARVPKHADAGNLSRLLRSRRERPRGCRAAKQREELAASIKKTRCHGTIAKRVGLSKRLRSAKDLLFSSSRVGRRLVGNSFDQLVGAQQEGFRQLEAERLGD